MITGNFTCVFRMDVCDESKMFITAQDSTPDFIEELTRVAVLAASRTEAFRKQSKTKAQEMLLDERDKCHRKVCELLSTSPELLPPVVTEGLLHKVFTLAVRNHTHNTQYFSSRR
jgi:hypothetical protein